MVNLIQRWRLALFHGYPVEFCLCQASWTPWSNFALGAGGSSCERCGSWPSRSPWAKTDMHSIHKRARERLLGMTSVLCAEHIRGFYATIFRDDITYRPHSSQVNSIDVSAAVWSCCGGLCLARERCTPLLLICCSSRPVGDSVWEVEKNLWKTASLCFLWYFCFCL